MHGTQACSRLELWAHAGSSTQRYSEYSSLTAAACTGNTVRYHYPDDDSEGPWDPLHLHFRDVTDVFIVFRLANSSGRVAKALMPSLRTNKAGHRTSLAVCDTGRAW